MKHIYKIAFLFLLIPALAVANNGMKGKHTKTKTVKKEFSVNSNATVDLDNKYGGIDIKTWDQNKVSLEIIITTNSNNENKAQDRLNEINIEIDASNSRVSAHTRIGKSSNWNWGNNNNVNMDIQYIVRMPKSNDLVVDMDYGNIIIDKLNGNADVNCDYGKLIAGDLLGAKTDINLDYSRGSSVDNIGNANINIDYSSLDIQTAGNITMNTDYSDTSFGNVETLSYNTDYGSVSADNAKSVEGNSDYANLKFGKISDKLNIEADYGNLKVDEMGVNFTSVYIDTQYLGVKIGVNTNSSFKLSAVSKYGGISVPDGMEYNKQIEKNTSKEYHGTYNGGSKGKINITTQYGSIKITEK